MKNLIKLLCFLIIVSCTSKSGSTDSGSESEAAGEISWSEASTVEFMNHCQTLAKSFKEEGHEVYCDCLLTDVSQQFPNYDEVHDFTQSKWLTLIAESDCHDDEWSEDYGSGWDDEAETAFMDGCVSAQLASDSSKKEAETFCDCAFGQIKSMVPNPHLANMILEEEVAAILENCK